MAKLRGQLQYLRFRAIRAGLLLLVCACLVSVAEVLARRPEARAEPLLLVTLALAAGLLLYSVWRSYARTDSQALERGGWLALALALVLVLERIVAGWLLLPEGAGAATLLTAFAFVPLLLVFAFTVLPARIAVPAAWSSWALVLAAGTPPLWQLGRQDWEQALLLALWLWAALPLMLRWLGLLPRFEDALERSQAEADALRKRAELSDRLAESERRFNLVVESLQVGAWDRRIGENGYRWWSPRFYELIGYTPEELPADDESLNRIIHPDDRERVMAQSAEQLRDGDVTSIDFRIMTRDRGYRWFNSVSKAERGPDGEIRRLAGAIADIHDRRVAEQELLSAKVQLTRLAYRDSLTGLHNRRSFNEQIQVEIDRAVRYRRPLSLLIADLDYFKAYNDRYGHAEGDQCLVSFAGCMTESMTRSSDLVARLGGEEFAMVLPETDADGAREAAARFVARVEQARMRHEGSPRGVVTVSVGIATYAGDGSPVTPQCLFTRADEALYWVKQRSRNDYAHYDDGPPDAAAAAAQGE